MRYELKISFRRIYRFTQGPWHGPICPHHHDKCICPDAKQTMTGTFPSKWINNAESKAMPWLHDEPSLIELNLKIYFLIQQGGFLIHNFNIKCRRGNSWMCIDAYTRQWTGSYPSATWLVIYAGQTMKELKIYRLSIDAFRTNNSETQSTTNILL